MPSFDWYQATLTDQQPDEVLAVLKEFFPRTDMKRGRLLYGYKEAVDLVCGDHRIVSLMWGLHSSPDPHIQFTGSDAIEGASLCRKLWPNHRVSRVDSAMDWYSTGAWDELSSLALEVAQKHHLKVQHVGDFLRGENGRTLYIGSKSSPVFVCLYEKGKQPGMELLGEPHWVRLEVRVRPKSSAKAQCATITPPEVFGCALWTKELYQRLTGSSIARHRVGTQYEPTDDDRAFAALVKQYGPLVVRLCSTMGAKSFAKSFSMAWAGTALSSNCYRKHWALGISPPRAQLTITTCTEAIMANSNLTTNSYHSLNALDMSIRAFVELARVLPEEDGLSPLLVILASRIESDFAVMRNDSIKLWRDPEEEDAERS